MFLKSILASLIIFSFSIGSASDKKDKKDKKDDKKPAAAVYDKVSVFLEGNQVIPNGDNPTILVFNREILDTNDEYDLATGIWTAKSAGFVSVSAMTRLRPIDGRREKGIHVYVNGATYKAYVFSTPNEPGPILDISYPITVGVIPVQVGTTIEIRASNGEAGEVTAEGNSFNQNDGTFLTINYIP